MTSQRLVLAAGILGFTGVALGAFGAHGLKDTLESTGQFKTWEKAVFYQLVHAVALFGLSARPSSAGKMVGWSWLAGVVCFSGSLYWLALGGPVRIIWPITPLGGLLLLTGWAILIGSVLRRVDE